mmetsp:Transcript_1385/g.4041  ORF Transcript_1385/g.4041 Transcript_1385/m.4041 type:complete len:600 (+) Transcript_1385:118-1917(+)
MVGVHGAGTWTAPFTLMLASCSGAKLTPNAIGRHSVAVHADGLLENVANARQQRPPQGLVRLEPSAPEGTLQQPLRVESTLPVGTPQHQRWTAPTAPRLGTRLGVMWLMVTSLAFLAVGAYAWLTQCYWLSALFLAQGLICVAYHFCDEEGPELMLGLPKGCPPQAARLLCHCDHGLAYLLFGQMASVVLGPEDPAMQRINEEMSCDRWTASPHMKPQGLGTPWDVLLLNRIGASVTMIVFLRTYASWSRFHWDCVVLTTAALALNVLSFWSLRGGRAAAVLLRWLFWRRAAECLLPALFGSAVLFAAMEASGNAEWLHGSWHLALSIAAALVMRRVLRDPCATFGHEDLQRSPVVGHHIFWLAPALASAAGALYAAAPREGAVALADAQPRLACALGLAAIAAGAAAVAMWQVVDLMAGADEDERLLRSHAGAQGHCGVSSDAGPLRGNLRGAASQIGCVAAGFGVLGLAASSLPDGARAVSMALFLLLQTAAFALASVPSCVRSASPSLAARCRAGIVCLLCVAELAAAALRLLRDGTAGSASVDFKATAFVKLAVGLLHAAWPVTWLCQASEGLTFCLQRCHLQVQACDKLSKGGQ